MQQDQDPANDPVAQAGRRTLAIDRGEQHHEQSENQNVEHFVFHGHETRQKRIQEVQEEERNILLFPSVEYRSTPQTLKMTEV
jgi:hypothetical protein